MSKLCSECGSPLVVREEVSGVFTYPVYETEEEGLAGAVDWDDEEFDGNAEVVVACSNHECKFCIEVPGLTIEGHEVVARA